MPAAQSSKLCQTHLCMCEAHHLHCGILPVLGVEQVVVTPWGSRWWQQQEQSRAEAETLRPQAGHATTQNLTSVCCSGSRSSMQQQQRQRRKCQHVTVPQHTRFCCPCLHHWHTWVHLLICGCQFEQLCHGLVCWGWTMHQRQCWEQHNSNRGDWQGRRANKPSENRYRLMPCDQNCGRSYAPAAPRIKTFSLLCAAPFP
jgi:hypothetical protein